MPELPEVETICRQLSKLIVGKKIKKVEIKLAKIVKVPSADFRRALVGAKVKKVSRRAKILIFELDKGWSMLAHLKMTGQMIYQESQKSPASPSEAGRAKVKSQNLNKYTHVIFYFEEGSRLFFNDLRQFGYLKIVKSVELSDYFLKEKVGPEPLAEDFMLVDFEALLNKKPKAKIKQFLMDPKNIAGIGNIYSDEILFFAGIHPLRSGASLKYNERRKAYRGIKKILTKAIRLKGTSANDYLDAFGQKGEFLSKLKVYGREGEKCLKCKNQIIRIKIGGRSAHFCPACQRLKP